MWLSSVLSRWKLRNSVNKTMEGHNIIMPFYSVQSQQTFCKRPDNLCLKFAGSDVSTILLADQLTKWQTRLICKGSNTVYTFSPCGSKYKVDYPCHKGNGCTFFPLLNTDSSVFLVLEIQWQLTESRRAGVNLFLISHHFHRWRKRGRPGSLHSATGCQSLSSSKKGFLDSYIYTK